MTIIITLVVLFLIVGIFIYHDHMEWSRLVKDAITTQRCPFCGLLLHKYRYQDKDYEYVAYTCPTCEFSTSVKTEKSGTRKEEIFYNEE